jgi:hypothetical protein
MNNRFKRTLAAERLDSPLKRCSQCNEDKPKTEFKKAKGTVDGLGSWCLPCRREYQRKWRAANRDKVDAQNARRRVGYRPEAF